MIKIDAHTHTIVSGHAYNTMDEMINYAKEQNMELLCITEHGPSLPGSAHEFYFSNMHILKKKKTPIPVLFGCEANILNVDGEIDIDDFTCKRQQIIIASLHSCCFPLRDKKSCTKALINACKNPYINILGHIDDGTFEIDYEKVIREAKETRTIIEMNNSSHNPEGFRKNAKENDYKILHLCKDLQVPICLSSDAHIKEEIGDFSYIIPILKDVNFPETLIANRNKDAFLNILRKGDF